MKGEGEKLECPNCGAKEFIINPLDESEGVCYAENMVWTIRPGDKLRAMGMSTERERMIEAARAFMDNRYYDPRDNRSIRFTPDRYEDMADFTVEHTNTRISAAIAEAEKYGKTEYANHWDHANGYSAAIDKLRELLK